MSRIISPQNHVDVYRVKRLGGGRFYVTHDRDAGRVCCTREVTVTDEDRRAGLDTLGEIAALHRAYVAMEEGHRVMGKVAS